MLNLVPRLGWVWNDALRSGSGPERVKERGRKCVCECVCVCFFLGGGGDFWFHFSKWQLLLSVVVKNIHYNTQKPYTPTLQYSTPQKEFQSVKKFLLSFVSVTGFSKSNRTLGPKTYQNKKKSQENPNRNPMK